MTARYQTSSSLTTSMLHLGAAWVASGAPLLVFAPEREPACLVTRALVLSLAPTLPDTPRHWLLVDTKGNESAIDDWIVLDCRGQALAQLGSEGGVGGRAVVALLLTPLILAHGLPRVLQWLAAQCHRGQLVVGVVQTTCHDERELASLRARTGAMAELRGPPGPLTLTLIGRTRAARPLCIHLLVHGASGRVTLGERAAGGAAQVRRGIAAQAPEGAVVLVADDEEELGATWDTATLEAAVVEEEEDGY